MKRVLTARFMPETNTFSRVPTDMAMIRRRDYHLENEIPSAFRGTRSAFGATFEAADKFGWTLVHPVSANPNPSGIVTDEAFERITAMLLDAVDTFMSDACGKPETVCATYNEVIKWLGMQDPAVLDQWAKKPAAQAS